MIDAIIVAQAQEVRIDLFDRHGRRTGWVSVDPKSGRFDQYDVRGNRTGYGTLSSPLPGQSYEPNDPNKKPVEPKK